MPLFVVERKFAEQIDNTDDDIKRFEEVNADEGIRWLYSFLSADRKQAYCLYEAPSAEAMRPYPPTQRTRSTTSVRTVKSPKSM